MNKKIYLIRHGRIDTENEKRYVGITDLSLDREGVEQAYSLKSYFGNISIDKVYTSPLKRCLQTAVLLPEGESFHQLANRVMLVFDSIVKKDQQTIMIIAHAGVNRVIISNILGYSIGELFRIQQPYGCVNELLLNEETKEWKLGVS